MYDTSIDDFTLLEKVEYLQNTLIARATAKECSDADYQYLREQLMANSSIKGLLPSFVRTSRTLSQFWGMIKPKIDNYEGRRKYIWDAFRPLLDKLEGIENPQSPHNNSVSSTLSSYYDLERVHSEWKKASDRRHEDPEAAITSARTLLEAVCKHILDEEGVEYDDGLDLPKLYKETSKALNLAPEQHQEPIFKQILQGCYSVVTGLGSLRNKLGDAHGKGKKAVKPEPRHAAFAVNLAGSVAEFLIETWKKDS